MGKPTVSVVKAEVSDHFPVLVDVVIGPSWFWNPAGNLELPVAWGFIFILRMDTFWMRLRVLFCTKCLLWLLVIGGGGYFVISTFGESQVAGFHLNAPFLEPVEVFIKEQLSGRYSSIATGWVGSTLLFLWGYIGRQLKRAEKMV